MRFHAHIIVTILIAFVTMRQASAQNESNDISLTTIVITNGSSISMGVSAPPGDYIAMEWSLDLATWHPYEWVFVGPTNTYNMRPIFVVSEDGNAVISVSLTSEDTRKYYRATRWEPPPYEWPTPIPLSKTKRKR